MEVVSSLQIYQNVEEISHFCDAMHTFLHNSSSLSAFGSCVTKCENGQDARKQHTDLHPEEHPLIAGLELEDEDPASGAGRHRLELHIVGEDNQVILSMAL